jgi:hypothetical protein
VKQVALSHEFVDEIPVDLNEGRLYISIRYRTAAHLCACGCGRKVVTPIKPPKWHVTFDGETVSLWPSIGRWQLPCRSHYWIRRNQIVWAKPWTDRQIREGREEDAEDLRRYYFDRSDGGARGGAQLAETQLPAAEPGRGLIDRFRGLFRW